MNKKIISGLVMALLIATALQAVGAKNEIKINTSYIQQPIIEWEKTFGSDEFDWFYCVESTSDGGYIATGVSEESDMNYAWLVKVDTNGDEDWSLVNYNWFGTNEDEMLVSCVRQTKNGDYVVGGLGLYYNTYHGYWSVSGYLWKVNSVGSTLWFKPLINEEEEWTIVPMVFEEDSVDYGFHFGGMYIKIIGSGYLLDVVLAKTDSDGNLDWYKNYDAGGFDFARSLDITGRDDNYFLSGTTQNNPDVENNAFYMLLADSDGDKVSDKIYDGPGFDYSPVMGCGQANDDGYIMCGVSYTYETDSNDLRIIKTDNSLNLDWEKTYGGLNDDSCYGMVITNDGYVFNAIKNAYINTGTKADLWLIQTDNDGNTLWELLLEKEEIQWLQSIVQTDDGGFILAGRNGGMDSKSSDGLLVKVSSFENQRPDKPTRPSGPAEGKPGTEYTFTTSTTDPDGDDVLFKWDWGDGTYSEWLDTDEAKHTWTDKGEYEVKVMAKDEHGGESDWSDPLSVTMPKSKNLYTNQILVLLQRYPNLFQMIQQLFGL